MLNRAKKLYLTKSYCEFCNNVHDAKVIEKEGKVYGTFLCDKNKRQVLLSNHADLYQKLITKSNIVVGSTIEEPTQKTLLELIEITTDCNFKCPICYANCEPEKIHDYMTVEQAVAKAKKAKEKGVFYLTLTGGEPTQHPELIKIVEAVAKIHPHVILVSNGLTLGRDPKIIKALKKAGLKQISVSFDTFDPLVHQQMRGNTFIKEKLNAIENVAAAGIKISLIVTVSSLNLKDLPEVIKYAMTLSPVCRNIILQIAGKIGRFDVDLETPVFKEDVIKTLIADPFFSHLSEDHFWPLPSYAPWGIHCHPDCGVNCFLLTDKKTKQFVPIDHYLSLAPLFKKLRETSPGNSFFKKAILPIYYLLSVAHFKHLPKLISYLYGKATGRGDKGVFQIATANYFLDEFRDESRLKHCTTVISGVGDEPRSPCSRFSKAGQHGFY